MAYYIIYFNGNKVIDVSKYSENEYEDYLQACELAIERCDDIQHGYF